MSEAFLQMAGIFSQLELAMIRSQQDYDEIWQYIENNPQKWIMQKNNLG